MAYITKIGIIGPKPFVLNGHDIDNTLRKSVREKMKEIIKEVQDDNTVVVGYTGLDLGSQQDFALACIDMGIDYHCVSPFENLRQSLFGISEILPLYDELIDRALSVTYLSEGFYSPKKTFTYENYILKNCDIVIFVRNGIRKEYSFNNDKVITIDMQPIF